MILTPSFATVLRAVPTGKTGVAVGTIVTLRMVTGAIGLACMYLIDRSVYKDKLPAVGVESARIASFSTLHLALGFLIIVTFAITFVLHSRKSAHQLPEFPGEGWD